jgi:hypothetical protein
MKISSSDRRLSRRLNFKTPLRVRIWKSAGPEHRTESVNLSQNGVFFATDSPIREGETVEILLKMPEEITDEPTGIPRRNRTFAVDAPSGLQSEKRRSSCSATTNDRVL